MDLKSTTTEGYINEESIITQDVGQGRSGGEGGDWGLGAGVGIPFLRGIAIEVID